MKEKYYILTLAFLLLGGLAIAQPQNDDCLGAIQIDQVTDWCSAANAFSNVGASVSAEVAPSCFPPGPDSRDVWFFFVATANTLNINVRGAIANNPGGTMESPQLAVYDGDCLSGLNELDCFSDAFGNNFAETFVSGLFPGNIYYVRVSARFEGQGSFQLCMNNFNQPPAPQSDCATAVILCDKETFSVDYLLGGGLDPNEILGASCIDPATCGAATETSSAWYIWTCDQPGSLTFSLTPNNPDDDLDFLVYRLPGGVEDCSNKVELRCMASGENTNEPLSEWVACTGSTGLQFGDPDSGEACGCQSALGNNNFLAPIDMEAGVSYALIINNFSNSSSGFAISWGGTGTFLGPQVDFDLSPADNIECDEEISLIDASIFGGGNIVEWNWYFGQGANPQSADTQGPHAVTYESFGQKFITLTVLSDGGCLVTKTVPLEVQECCDLTGNVTLDLITKLDPICPDDENGIIEVSGSGGNPQYLYSINNSQPLPYSVFTQLPAGDYDILVQDIKGCQDEIPVDLNDPPPIFVDAGMDTTISLGQSTLLQAFGTPTNSIEGYLWTMDNTLSCLDCFDPLASPVVTTTYEVTAFNDEGCGATDRITVFISEDRPIYIPNVISPNGDGSNDRFYIFGNNAAMVISEIRIFNRWGALVYEETNMPLGETTRAWDGTFNGQDVNPGVFAFYAIINFIDDRDVLFEGDITVLR